MEPIPLCKNHVSSQPTNQTYLLKGLIVAVLSQANGETFQRSAEPPTPLVAVAARGRGRPHARSHGVLCGLPAEAGTLLDLFYLRGTDYCT